MKGCVVLFPDLQPVGLVPGGQQNARLAQVAQTRRGKTRPRRLRPRPRPRPRPTIIEQLGRRGGRGHGHGQVAGGGQRLRRHDLAVGLGQGGGGLAVAVALRRFPRQQVLRPGDLPPQPLPGPDPIAQQLLSGTEQSSSLNSM